MTHTEKADELIEKFGDKASGVVDEIIIEVSYWHETTSYEETTEFEAGKKRVDYWQSIKQYLITKL